jgi:hypothetical protein
MKKRAALTNDVMDATRCKGIYGKMIRVLMRDKKDAVCGKF